MRRHRRSRWCSRNPAIGLGLLTGAGAQAGRDKMTLVVPESLLDAFGLWVEQLVAEVLVSRGSASSPLPAKHSTGPTRTVPTASSYVSRSTREASETTRDAQFAALSAAPAVTIDFPEPAALGAEFVRWEIATAIAGAILGVNPFDEPNVQTAKDATNVLLARHKADGTLPMGTPDLVLDGQVALTLSTAARQELNGAAPASILSLVRTDDYVGILAYLGPDPGACARPRYVPDRRTAAHACRDDVRIRTEIPALDRTAAQRGREQRRLRVDQRVARAGRRHSRATLLVRHARARAGHRRLQFPRFDRTPRRSRASLSTRRRVARRRARSAAAELTRIGRPRQDRHRRRRDLRHRA
ncbi:MAG: hypothetical protein QM736_13900 [Vicinamibacterales bacterium]